MLVSKKLLIGCLVALMPLPGFADEVAKSRSTTGKARVIRAEEAADETEDQATPEKSEKAARPATKPKVIAAKKKDAEVVPASAQIAATRPSQLNGKLRNASHARLVDNEQMPAEDVAPGACGGTCGSCNSCDACSAMDCCCDPFWRHHNLLFGDFLYQKNFSPDMVHATQQNAAPAGPGTVPFGRVGELIPHWQSGARFGGELAINDCSSIGVSFSELFTHTTDSMGLPGGTNTGSVISSVLAPGTINAGTTFSQVNANYDVDYKLGDINFSHLIAGSDSFYLNYDVGLRYGHLTQDFSQDAEFAQPNNPQQTSTHINFDGMGLRTGFDGRRRLGCGGLSVYSQGFASVLFGRFHSSYTQVDALSTSTLATANWQSDRVVPMLDYEVGLSWTSCSGRWRVTTGYNMTFWFNVVSTPGLIQAVQNTNYHNVGDTLTFTGAVTRLEYLF